MNQLFAYLVWTILGGSGAWQIWEPMLSLEECERILTQTSWAPGDGNSIALGGGAIAHSGPVAAVNCRRAGPHELIVILRDDEVEP